MHLDPRALLLAAASATDMGDPGFALGAMDQVLKRAPQITAQSVRGGEVHVGPLRVNSPLWQLDG